MATKNQQEAHEEREEMEKRILEENKKKVADYLAEQVKEKEEREKAEIEEHNKYFEELLVKFNNGCWLGYSEWVGHKTGVRH